MVADVHAASDFYGTARGGVAARLLRARLGALWPEVRGEAILGIGYAAPYLRLWREHAGRCIALTPAQVGVARWPAGKPNLSCTAEEDCLPSPTSASTASFSSTGWRRRTMRAACCARPGGC